MAQMPPATRFVDVDERAFRADIVPAWDQGESRMDELSRMAHWAGLFPDGDPDMVAVFRALHRLARRHHRQTGRHLAVYGVLGELFGAAAYGIRLARRGAQGSDGRLGRDHVEIKTIGPVKQTASVPVRLAERNFSKLLVVKVAPDFTVTGRMVDRKSLGKGQARQVRWDGLAPSAPV